MWATAFANRCDVVELRHSSIKSLDDWGRRLHMVQQCLSSGLERRCLRAEVRIDEATLLMGSAWLVVNVAFVFGNLGRHGYISAVHKRRIPFVLLFTSNQLRRLADTLFTLFITFSKLKAGSRWLLHLVEVFVLVLRRPQRDQRLGSLQFQFGGRRALVVELEGRDVVGGECTLVLYFKRRTFCWIFHH